MNQTWQKQITEEQLARERQEDEQKEGLTGRQGATA